MDKKNFSGDIVRLGKKSYFCKLKMNKKAHKTLLWVVAVLAIIGVGVFVLSRTSIGESVKRESARLFDYEYIPNQNVEIAGTAAAAAAD